MCDFRLSINSVIEAGERSMLAKSEFQQANSRSYSMVLDDLVKRKYVSKW